MYHLHVILMQLDVVPKEDLRPENPENGGQQVSCTPSFCKLELRKKWWGLQKYGKATLLRLLLPLMLMLILLPLGWADSE